MIQRISDRYFKRTFWDDNVFFNPQNYLSLKVNPRNKHVASSYLNIHQYSLENLPTYPPFHPGMDRQNELFFFLS